MMSDHQNRFKIVGNICKQALVTQQ